MQTPISTCKNSPEKPVYQPDPYPASSMLTQATICPNGSIALASMLPVHY